MHPHHEYSDLTVSSLTFLDLAIYVKIAGKHDYRTQFFNTYGTMKPLNSECENPDPLKNEAEENVGTGGKK